MSVIASSGVDGDDEELQLSKKLWDKIREKGFDYSDSEKSEDEEPSSDEEEQSSDEGSDSDSSVDEKAAAVERMADEFEQQIKQQREYAMTVDRKVAKTENKKRLQIEA